MPLLFFKAMNMYEQIRSNKQKTFFIILIFFALANFISYSIGVTSFDNVYVGMIIVNVILLIYMGVSILKSTLIIMSLNKAKKIEQKDNTFLWNTVESLSLVANIPMPSVYIIDSPNPNAFATGITPEKSAVAVTTGLLERLNREEIEAVICHELAHIANRDCLLTATFLGLLSALIFVLDIFTRTSCRSRNSKDKNSSGILTVVLIIVGVLAPVIGNALMGLLSRNREYLADSTAVKYCMNPNALISALQKISSDESELDSYSESCAFIYFNNPDKEKRKKEKASLFDTHPPISARINRLRNM